MWVRPNCVEGRGKAARTSRGHAVLLSRNPLANWVARAIYAMSTVLAGL